MKNSMPKPRLINILFWAIAVAFSLLYWGLINLKLLRIRGKLHQLVYLQFYALLFYAGQFIIAITSYL